MYSTVLAISFKIESTSLEKKSQNGAIHHLNIYNLACHLKSHFDLHFIIASLKQIRKVT